MHVERHLNYCRDDESGLPDYLRTVPWEDDGGAFGSLRSQQRRRPRLWSDNPTAPPVHDYDSDSEDEGLDREDDEDDDHDDYQDDEGLHRCQQRDAKRRRLSPPEYLARPHAGGLALRAALLPARARRALVSFSSPLIAEVHTRPRTHPDDVRMLFYSRADERRFREEARRERDGDAEDEDNPGRSEDEEMEAEKRRASKTEVEGQGLDAAAGGSVIGAQTAAATEGGAALVSVGVLEDPSEVTESSSSDSSSEEEEDESDDDQEGAGCREGDSESNKSQRNCGQEGSGGRDDDDQVECC